ncbi:pantoate--beta-alanine ligase [Halobacteriovorax sp. HLS]|uniref:pantoate--beta-alanine ligase n=1 Tax=Halobacteriovorax sp. HLS TaxID=2234000 RepID=UPI000FD8852D|nr:pantoate--beta-alanine ligase [Halobacteriovorax sp. HLS]
MNNIFTCVNEFLKFRRSITNKSVGLIPTMGNLHEGHLSLISASLEENDLTVVTIFVNPKQFGPNEDFDKYPRTLEADAEKIRSLDPNIIILAPKSNDEIYPQDYSTNISVSGLTNKLCALDRPTHFDGVTTVVYRLFALVKAQKAYFGQKDYQQVLIIKRMVEDLMLDVEIIMLPIHREANGLARSSRNQYLCEKDRENALILSKTIFSIQALLEEFTYNEAVIEINTILESTLKDSNWNYLEILDATNLDEVSITTTEVVIAGAYKLGTTRLIDNTLVKINYA